MKRFLTWAVASLFAVGVSQAEAGGISPFGYGYDTSMELIVDASGSVGYLGPSFGDIFDATAGDLRVDSLDLDDAASAAFSLGGSNPIGPISSATEVFIAQASTGVTDYLAFFFEDATNGYLVEVDVTGLGLNFLDDFAFIDSPAKISLTKYSVSPIPLPAGLPLLLAGMGAFAFVRRRQS